MPLPALLLAGGAGGLGGLAAGGLAAGAGGAAAGGAAAGGAAAGGAAAGGAAAGGAAGGAAAGGAAGGLGGMAPGLGAHMPGGAAAAAGPPAGGVASPVVDPAASGEFSPYTMPNDPVDNFFKNKLGPQVKQSLLNNDAIRSIQDRVSPEAKKREEDKNKSGIERKKENAGKPNLFATLFPGMGGFSPRR